MLQLNGNTLAPGYLSRLNALSIRLEQMGLPAIGVASGRRSKALQEQIFRDRYRRQDSGSGPFGDVRWWDGNGDGVRERWVRVKDGGTVLPPGDSTHEDPPATGADLAWPYNNRYTAAHAALLTICEDYGIRWTGRGFGEDWHFDSIWDPYVTFASGGAQPFEEDDMNNEQDLRLKNIENALLGDGTAATPQPGGAIDVLKNIENAILGDGRRFTPHPLSLASIIRGFTGFVDRRISDLAGWTRDDANSTRAAISSLQVAGTDPAKIAEAIAPLIPKGASAKDVADELARRLAS